MLDIENATYYKGETVLYFAINLNLLALHCHFIIIDIELNCILYVILSNLFFGTTLRYIFNT